MARAFCVMFPVPPAAADFPYSGETLPAPAPTTERQFGAYCDTPRVSRPDRHVRAMPAFDVYVLPARGTGAYR